MSSLYSRQLLHTRRDAPARECLWNLILIEFSQDYRQTQPLEPRFLRLALCLLFLGMEIVLSFPIGGIRIGWEKLFRHLAFSRSLKTNAASSFGSWRSRRWLIPHVLILCHSSDDFVVQKPELSTPSICHAPGGEYFVEGETWNIDSCTQCTCHSGRVLCETEVCPPLLCQNPSRTQDSCCPQCTGNQNGGTAHMWREGCSFAWWFCRLSC